MPGGENHHENSQTQYARTKKASLLGIDQSAAVSVSFEFAEGYQKHPMIRIPDSHFQVACGRNPILLENSRDTRYIVARLRL